MKRLSTSSQKQKLRTTAIKHHGIHDASSIGEKIDSPLMKVDANGNFSCVICRTSLKSSLIWKVHVNSRNHKNNVQASKELKNKLQSSAKNISVEKEAKQETKFVPKTVKEAKSIETKIKENIQILAKVEAPKATESSTRNTTHEPLPEEFFDKPPVDSKVGREEKDKEWELFQKEIKEVTEAANEIFATDQKELAVEKEIVEIDEQIQHWSKVLDLEEKRKKLGRRMAGNYTFQEKTDDTSGESSESEEFEEYTDWRSKGFK
ncbi:zinc finger protein 830 [Haematobia irritans]|uniref:zinc finger protein 830 n=1 Tax=Haematobia irritans TaxID=7368 RepID=UPI003F503576